MDTIYTNDTKATGHCEITTQEQEEILRLQNEIATLNTTIYELKGDVERCMDIIARFQELSCCKMNQNENKIYMLEDEMCMLSEELNKHVNSLHAMLIIGNKKDENK